MKKFQIFLVSRPMKGGIAPSGNGTGAVPCTEAQGSLSVGVSGVKIINKLCKSALT